jgi:hypothetical protein
LDFHYPVILVLAPIPLTTSFQGLSECAIVGGGAVGG